MQSRNNKIQCNHEGSASLLLIEPKSELSVLAEVSSIWKREGGREREGGMGDYGHKGRKSEVI